MDTPERNQIGTSLSKFEDSPVFNYINSLSPIKSVKSLHITQAFSSISFASLPSIFTSPHVSAHKESRFLLRHCNSDPSKPECSSENESGNKVGTSEGVVTDATKQHHKSAVLHENCDLAITVGEASPEADNDYSNFVIELPRCLKYDCGSPNCESTPSGNKVDSSEELADQSASLVPFVVETSEKGPSDVQAQVQGMCEMEQKQEPALCGWEGLNCDASDMLIFNSPNSTETLKGLLQTSLEPVTRFCNSLMPEILQKEIYNEHQMHSSDLLSCDEQQETEDPSSQPGEAVPQEQIEQLQGTIAITRSSNGVSSERTDNEAETCTAIACKSVLNLHRGLRRRCLDFEMAGARKRNLGDAPNTSISLQSNEKIGLNDRQVVQIKPGSDSRCTLPGIGLHLNALVALNSKDQKITNNEILSSGRHSLILSPTALSYSNTADQEPLQKSITSDCSEGDTDAAGNGVQLMHDACQAQPFLTSEEFNHNSPKKKRRKLDNIGDNDVACKRCNCKKSKCLKLYCECFAAGVYCIEPCSCQDCFNKPIHEDTVLATRKQIESRNPLAFAPKVIRSSDSVPEFGDESSKTPASSRHKRGCNCKKSNCLKKYCECYQGGVGCSVGCRCEGCKNAFGRKDGSSLTGIEAELDEDETEACEKDNPSRKLEILNNGEQNPASSVPMTPLRLSRQLGTLPFSSKGKLPGSSFLTITSSSRLYGGQKLGQPNVLQSQLKFEKQMQTAPEDEMPDILRGDCSPSTGIKTSSPNSKRISPPQCDFGSSPSRKSGRKLILQSIPSFPSLTQQ